jgi:zinc D-Ala-D-Ala dipeptidase
LIIKLNAQLLHVVTTKKEYLQSTNMQSKNEMYDLKLLIPNLQLDLKYATTSNFTKVKLYKKATTTFLREEPAHALLKVQQQLNLQGLGLKIYDAYRPYSITKLMWNLIKDERYVANPAYGSGHNKGISVDLTIINLSTGIELNMGTNFDNFTDSAHHAFTSKYNGTIISNRNLIKSTMLAVGFKALETEWWHYSWASSDKYDVLDFTFGEIKKMNKKQ